jgi:hypothetical protein
MRETWPSRIFPVDHIKQRTHHVRHACSIPVFNVRFGGLFEAKKGTGVPNGQASHSFRCGAFTVLPRSRQGPTLKKVPEAPAIQALLAPGAAVPRCFHHKRSLTIAVRLASPDGRSGAPREACKRAGTPGATVIPRPFPAAGDGLCQTAPKSARWAGFPSSALGISNQDRSRLHPESARSRTRSESE